MKKPISAEVLTTWGNPCKTKHGQPLRGRNIYKIKKKKIASK